MVETNFIIMKKKKKKLKKSISKNQKKTKKKVKKIPKKLNKFKIKNKPVKKIYDRRKQKNKIQKKIKKPKQSKKISKKSKSTTSKKPDFLLTLVNFQNFLKPEFNFRLNFGFEKYIQAFFDKIADTISQYKILKKDEARRLKLEKQEKERLEKIEIYLTKKTRSSLKVS